MAPGRTCKYRTYISNSTSTSTGSASTTYNVTVDINYVYYNTYIGVYRYHTNSNSYELVREVGQNFSGTINTTINETTEIYVQMHPFYYLSCAGFDVSTIYVEPELSTQSGGLTQTASSGSEGTTGSTEGKSKSLSGRMIALIIMSLILGSAVLLFG